MNQDLEKKFVRLYENLTNEKFLNMQALGGEIPFYIVPYDPKLHNKVEKRVLQLKNRLKQSGISVLEINLFDLSLEILKSRGVLEKIVEHEKTLGKSKLFKTLQALLDSETKIVPKIKEEVKKNPSKILFLTGIGEVFPFIRSHTILNNLQNVVKDRPTVMFFPGTYTKELSLFGRLKDDNYYRAFNLDKLNL